MWNTYENGNSIGTTGSENGTIIFDEEYPGKARITVEECNRYHAITIGLSGAMFHTVFCNKDEYQTIVSDMKSDIEVFYCKKRSLSEETDFCDYFYMKY